MHHSSDVSDPERLLKRDGTPRTTLLFMHENAGNIGLRMDYFEMLYRDLDFNVLVFAYRGFSDSTLNSGAHPTERTL